MIISLTPEVLRLYRGCPGDNAYRGNIRTLLNRVKACGYDGIEMGTPEGFSPSEYQEGLEESGLAVTALHQRDTLDETLRECEQWQVNRVLSKPLPQAALGNPYELKQFINRLNETGRALREKGGVYLCYLNHAVDFAPMDYDGRTMLAHIVADTDERYVFFEPNTHWLQAGGGHVISWLRQLKGRIQAVRCMDYAIDPYSDHTFLECTHRRFAEVGTGNLNWPGILAECKAQGITHYTVSQDETFMPPYASIALSCKHLRAFLQ